MDNIDEIKSKVSDKARQYGVKKVLRNSIKEAEESKLSAHELIEE